MKTYSSRYAAQRAMLALAMLAGLSGCQTPVVVAPPQATPTPAADRNAEIARILDLQRRGVITDAQAVEILGALVNAGDGAAVPAKAPAPVSPAAPAVAVAAPVGTPAPAPLAVVAKAPAVDGRYQPKTVLTGRLRSIGSDTMDVLVASWERVFRNYHPDLRVIHEGRGTSTATPALLENQADFGPLSRAMLEPEAARFRERFGYDATQIRVAIDALGVYVHPDNPVAKIGLTLAQVDAIFSATRKRGEPARLTTWGQLGATGEWASAPIRAYGRNKASGTYGFFRDSALGKGEFGEWVQEQAGSELVVDNVKDDRFGIGYSGIGYAKPGVALAPLATNYADKPVAPSEEAALSGAYPLARPLYIATNRNPAAPLSDLQREFLTFVLGPVGQEVVKRDGYYPLPERLVAEEMAKLR